MKKGNAEVIKDAVAELEKGEHKQKLVKNYLECQLSHRITLDVKPQLAPHRDAFVELLSEHGDLVEVLFADVKRINAGLHPILKVN